MNIEVTNEKRYATKDDSVVLVVHGDGSASLTVDDISLDEMFLTPDAVEALDAIFAKVREARQ